MKILFAIVLCTYAVVNCSSSKRLSRLILVPKIAAPVQLLHLGSGNASEILYDEKVVKSLFLNPKLADRDVVVFSIIGAFRKGKSFLMNYVLRYMYANYKSVANNNLINRNNWLADNDEPLTGFEWKSGVKRVTTGLILWSDVFLYDGPNGEKFAIYLMDTQGLFDHKTTSVDNSRIFSLSTMISSVQILNLFNIIQEDHLQYLQFATEYARYASFEDEKSPFQRLLILIRDWNSPEEYRYGQQGGNAYLRSNLEIHDYQTRELQSVRRYLHSSFDKIDCFLMAYPGKTVARDSAYDGRWSEIDDEFVHGMQDLFELLFAPTKLTVKKINGVPIKPADLLIFINVYVQNFKKDGMPEATNIYQSTLEKQFRILIAKSVDVYVNAVATHDRELEGEEDINKLHLKAKEAAVKYFNKEKKFGTYSEGATFKNDLEKKIEESFQQWKKVSLSQLRKLQGHKVKTQQQTALVHQAQNLDNKAKEELASTVIAADEAKKAFESARYHTEEARREARQLADRSRQAENDRAEAIERERQTRVRLEQMIEEKVYFEKQYNNYKEIASKQVETKLAETKQSSGIASFFGEILPIFTAVLSFGAAFLGFIA